MSRKLVTVLWVLSAGILFDPVLTAADPGSPGAGDALLPAAWSAGEPDQDPVPGAGPGYIEGHLLVGFAPGTSPAVKRALHEQYGAQVVSDMPALNAQLLRVPEDSLAMVSAYQARPEVRYAEPDYIATIFGAPDPVQPRLMPAPLPGDGEAPDETPNDPLYSQQWHHAKIDSPSAWDRSHAEGIVVAVIDTGVDCDHPDLRGKCLPGYDHFNNDSDPRDDHGHGTHVAGIAASQTDNGVGGAATGWDARILPVKALGASGNGGLAAIASAVVWATDHDADIINMSLGGFYTSRTLQNAVAYAIAREVTVIAAAGNESTSNPTYPAAYPDVIGIAATTQSDGRASFSNYGSFVDLAAPGVAILSTVRGGSYQAWSGTSMASPVAAGVAALLKAQGPCRKPADVEAILERTADDIGTRGPDQYFGAGRLNAGRALADNLDPCSGGNPPPAPSPTAPGAQPTSAAPPTATRMPLPSGDCGGDLEGLINRRRADFGLPPLATHPSLRKAGEAHAIDLAITRQCSHIGSDGSDPFERMRRFGYNAPYGEIVACGQSTADTAVSAWMGSPGHRAIILCNDCSELGASCRMTADGYRSYWVVKFGAGQSGLPSPTLPPPPTATASPPPPTATEPPPPPPTPETSIPGSQTLILSPPSNRIGWVVSTEPTGNHFDSSFTYTGTWNDRLYHGAMQFDLEPLPPGAHINFARLRVVDQATESLMRVGTWSVNLMETDIDAGFENHPYPRIHAAGVEVRLLPLLAASDLTLGREHVFNLTGPALTALQARTGGSRRISFRMDGPTGGDFSNLASWETGYGPQSRPDRAPQLLINYSLGTPAALPSPSATELLPPSATPLPPTAGPSPTPWPTDPPPTATATAPPPRPTALPTATLVPPVRTPPTPGASVIEIPALPEDVGWVRQLETRNHLGEGDTYTGVVQMLEYHGMVQFDLSAVPAGASVLEARLTLTGLSAQRLAARGNGLWEVRLLESDVDAGWRFHGFSQIDGARPLTTMQPVLRQADLDAGHMNVLLFRSEEIREIEWRRATTGKLSFRLDGPRNGPSNLFNWDGGLGGNPPRLTIVYGPPRPDFQPPQPPDDAAKVDAIIALINQARAQAGLRPLAPSGALNTAAETHIWDMTSHDFFGHTGSDGSAPAERVARAGFSALAVEELIAANSGNADLVIQAWMGSAAHQERILDPRLTHIGADYDYAPGTRHGHYWTVEMAEAGP